VDANEVVSHHVQRNRMGVVFDLFREGVSQSGEPADVHPDRQVAAFDVACADMAKVWIARHCDLFSRFMTDESNVYARIGRTFKGGHQMVNHSAKEYVRDEAYTNTVEGFFSILKRGIYGVYQHVSEAHLHRYLSEFDFRYAHRIARGVDDVERFHLALTGIVGKQMTYQAVGGKRAAAPAA